MQILSEEGQDEMQHEDQPNSKEHTVHQMQSMLT